MIMDPGGWGSPALRGLATPDREACTRRTGRRQSFAFKRPYVALGPGVQLSRFPLWAVLSHRSFGRLWCFLTHLYLRILNSTSPLGHSRLSIHNTAEIVVTYDQTTNKATVKVGQDLRPILLPIACRLTTAGQSAGTMLRARVLAHWLYDESGRARFT